jgi:hypothetical protein
MQTVLSGGKDYQMVWMLIYNTDFLDALKGGYVSGHHMAASDFQRPSSLMVL